MLADSLTIISRISQKQWEFVELYYSERNNINLLGGGAPRSAAENVDYNEGTKCTKNDGSE